MKNKNILILEISIFAVLFVFSIYLLLFKTNNKVKSDDIKDIGLQGLVIEKLINKNNFEKTHIVILNNGTQFRIPDLELDNNIQVGDSIFKDPRYYVIKVFKNNVEKSTIIFINPCIN